MRQLLIFSILAFLFGCSGVPAQHKIGDVSSASSAGTVIDAEGAFSCDFALDMTKFVEPLGAEIERDRIFLQKKLLAETQPKTPGMLQKHIPFTPINATSGFSGGRYLFQGREQAHTYSSYINHTFYYPVGMQFLARPEFSNPECRDWDVVKAVRFQDVTTHTALRTERFDTGLTTDAQETALAAQLQRIAGDVVAAASSRSYAEVHLLHNGSDHKVQLVYFQSRMSGPSYTTPDVAAFGKLSSDSPLGDIIVQEANITRVFDRTGFALTIWQPYAPGDHGTPSLWPNTPPIPGPTCGDAVCTPSSGESGTSCPADCAATCGDAVCQEGEDQAHCPSDCGDPFVN